MKGRFWLFLGVAVGIAVAAGHLSYLAGAGRSLAETCERLVRSGADRLVRDAAKDGAPKRVVLGFSGIIAAALPGITALLVVIAAKGSLRVRAIIAVLVAALGAASFAYQPHGKAIGVLLLALLVAGLTVTLTGPIVAAPLVAVATLIGAEFLPGLLSSHRHVPQLSVNDLHFAIYGHPGTPAGLQVILLIVAIVPFAYAARLIIRG